MVRLRTGAHLDSVIKGVRTMNPSENEKPTPIRFIGVNDETRQRLRREVERDTRMRLIADLVRDEYHQLMRQEWKEIRRAEFEDTQVLGDDNAA